jgi:aminopeptidase-like protein
MNRLSTTTEPVRAPADDLYRFAQQYFPIFRSLTGPGIRQSLALIASELGPLGKSLEVCGVPSGTACFDWIVPDEWNIAEAYIEDAAGRKVVDFKENSLHIVGYSLPVDQVMTLDELDGHLFSLPQQPDAIPYITSYYKPFWGFCLSHNQRQTLTSQNYRVVIRSTLAPGMLNYGELVIPGASAQEVLISTDICHPNMGNNETSGPVVATFLAKWVQSLKERRYTYRFLFLPETIGSIVFLSRHLDSVKANTIAGFQCVCVGDDRAYSFLPTKNGDTLADRVALQVLQETQPDFIRYSFFDRGSDERQYNSPGIDLPVASIMRTKYGEYPEYHTSLDDLSVISAAGLGGAWEVYVRCIEVLERNHKYRVTCLGEPKLDKHGLYPTVSTKDTKSIVKNMMNLIVYADGSRDLIALSEFLNVPFLDLADIAESLLAKKVFERL